MGFKQRPCQLCDWQVESYQDDFISDVMRRHAASSLQAKIYGPTVPGKVLCSFVWPVIRSTAPECVCVCEHPPLLVSQSNTHLSCEFVILFGGLEDVLKTDGVLRVEQHN